NTDTNTENSKRKPNEIREKLLKENYNSGNKNPSNKESIPRYDGEKDFGNKKNKLPHTGESNTILLSLLGGLLVFGTLLMKLFGFKPKS
ncbi:LPXTG cell wall anchor domain-containing protein, partial [Enterococcus faecalis]|uniref:LPXTG cell wall anchor domain-containing protein n=3 Tax=Enterococcus TaxID=1350 RepID=UPI001A9582CC